MIVAGASYTMVTAAALAKQQDFGMSEVYLVTYVVPTDNVSVHALYGL